MRYYFILMTILGLLLFFYGLWVIYSNHPISKHKSAKKMEEEYTITGEMIMVIGVLPILSGVIGLIFNNVIIAVITLCLLFIISFLGFNYLYKKN